MSCAERSRSRFTDIVGIIPGKREPPILDCFLQPFMADLQRAGPGGQSAQSKLCIQLFSLWKLDTGCKLETRGFAGTPVSLTRRTGAGFITSKHHVLLVGVHADTPARAKISKFLPVSAYQNCGYCMFRSKR